MSQKIRPGPIRSGQKTVSDFASNTTLHGIKYIFDEKVLIFERIVWLLICIILTFLAIFLSLQNLYQWESSPIITSVGTTGIHCIYLVLLL